jgi:hypothetical protein
MAVRKTKKKASAQTVEATKPVAAASKPAAAVPHQSVAERAHAIWEASGCPHGLDCEHWFQAERELRGSRTTA